MTLVWLWPILRQVQFWPHGNLNGKSWFFFHFSVAIELLSMEMKSSASPLNARGQGHLVTLAKVTLIEKLWQNFGVQFFKNNKAKWKCIPYEAKMGWKRNNKSIIMSSFKSSRNIQKKESGLDRSVSDNQSSTVNELAEKARIIYCNVSQMVKVT